MQKVILTAQEIEEQKKSAAKCLALIQKELNYGNLVNLENVAQYTAAYKYHLQLVDNGCVYI